MNRIGHVAKCQQGATGLVVSIKRGGFSVLYRGFCLDPGKIGGRWESCDPEWAGTLDDWVMARATDLMMI